MAAVSNPVHFLAGTVFGLIGGSICGALLGSVVGGLALADQFGDGRYAGRLVHSGNCGSDFDGCGGRSGGSLLGDLRCRLSAAPSPEA
jgi:hypothetical protein